MGPFNPRFLDLYRQTAITGDPVGQAQLGRCYYLGSPGVTRDYTEAYKWFQLAANQKDSDGQAGLGLLYISGVHVKQDVKKGLELLQLTVNQGSAFAQLGLGDYYRRGIGVEKN